MHLNLDGLHRQVETTEHLDEFNTLSFDLHQRFEAILETRREVISSAEVEYKRMYNHYGVNVVMSGGGKPRQGVALPVDCSYSGCRPFWHRLRHESLSSLGGKMSTTPNRLVLEGVPRIGFYKSDLRCPEDIPFPSVMRALMEYFKEEDFGCRSCRSIPPGCKIPCSYAAFIGFSGVASFLNWKPGWDMDNVEIMYMSDDPEAPFRRAFQATGYEYKAHSLVNGRDNRAFFRQQIVESIQRGRPVLAFGPIGPPESAIISGYDEKGEVLVGWSFFQDSPDFYAGVSFEPSGLFRKSDWFDYKPEFSCIIIGEKKAQPPLAESYRRALEWMLQVARTPITFGNRHNGIAAYAAWAEHILQDGDFPNDEATLRQRHDVHNNVVGMVAEARWYGAQFLVQAASSDILPFNMTSDLLHAAAYYALEHELMWKLWNLAGGNGNPNAYRTFADPAVRRQMASVIKQSQENSASAAKAIERALSRK